jgi:hypothetical protein
MNVPQSNIDVREGEDPMEMDDFLLSLLLLLPPFRSFIDGAGLEGKQRAKKNRRKWMKDE